ncbi:unnamed protein product [Ixodes pacificus]
MMSLLLVFLFPAFRGQQSYRKNFISLLLMPLKKETENFVHTIFKAPTSELSQHFQSQKPFQLPSNLSNSTPFFFLIFFFFIIESKVFLKVENVENAGSKIRVACQSSEFILIRSCFNFFCVDTLDNLCSRETSTPLFSKAVSPKKALVDDGFIYRFWWGFIAVTAAP